MSTSEIPQVHPTKEKLYGDRDVIRQGNAYIKHVEAMTAEALHSKSDIAAELAHRDLIIADLQQFHDWAEPQIIHRGEDQLKIEQLQQQLSLAYDANGMIEMRVKETESDARRYRWLVGNCHSEPESVPCEPYLIHAIPYTANWRRELEDAIDAAISQGAKP